MARTTKKKEETVKTDFVEEIMDDIEIPDDYSDDSYEMDIEKFQDKIKELQALAKSKKNELEYKDVQDVFQDIPLEDEQFDKVLDMLEDSGIDVVKDILEPMQGVYSCRVATCKEGVHHGSIIAL